MTGVARKVVADLRAIGAHPAAMMIEQLHAEIDEIKVWQMAMKAAAKAADEIYSQRIDQLETELIQVRSERDAAIADLKDALDRGDAASFCEFCKHNDDWGKCEHPCNPYSGETGWEWRGLPEPPKEEVG